MKPETRADRQGRPMALIRGAGDLASGVAVRLYRAGFAIIMTEIAAPTPVRRSVAFADAVYCGAVEVEGIQGVSVAGPGEARRVMADGAVAVVVDAEAAIVRKLRPLVLVDAIMAKRNLGTRISDAPVVIALGPGFVAGRDVHAVIETKRGHTLGRVIREGEALPNTGVPGEVGGHTEERLLRAPCDGEWRALTSIGDSVGSGELVGSVAGVDVRTRVGGAVRGLLHSGLEVTEGFKLGDVDPRAAPDACTLVSDKALAVGGGALEAACELLGGVRFSSASRARSPADSGGKA